MNFRLTLVALLINLKLLCFTNVSLTVKLVGSNIESRSNLLLANFENSTPKFINDSTVHFDLKLDEPVLIHLIISKSWYKKIWMTNYLDRTIIINFKTKDCFLINKNRWDTLLDSLLVFESKNQLETKDSIELNYIKKHKTAFESLWLFTHSHNIFTKNNPEKITLFNQLDKSLMNYPLYKLTKASLKKRNYPNLNDDFLEFELIDVNDKPLKTKNITNKIILLHFWSTTCAPCIRELDNWLKYSATLDTSKINIIFICLDPNEKMWRNTSAKFSIPQPNLFAENNLFCDLCLYYNLNAIPYTLIFDKKKKLKLFIEGTEIELVKKEVQSMLGQK